MRDVVRGIAGHILFDGQNTLGDAHAEAYEG
jgi:hypothetical protein